MDIYLVGGAVRDIIMGKDPKDYDYVVVGSSPEEMLSLGFQQVGADFPVFLHPKSGDEYALARTERKTGKGYHAFETDASSSVTLEEDLARRDFTMNAMALPVEINLATGKRESIDTSVLVDPFGGMVDIANGVIHRTSLAFAEDPVRILRAARFAARYQFEISKATMDLMQDMVVEGEVDSLVPERVFAEFEKGLMEEYPELMMNVLIESNAAEVIVSGLSDYNQKALMEAASMDEPFEVRFLIVMDGVSHDDVVSLKASSRINKLKTHLENERLLLLNPLRHLEESFIAHNLHDFLRAVDIRRDYDSFMTLLDIVGYLYIQPRSCSYDEVRITLEELAQVFLSVNEGKIAKAVDNKAMIPGLIRDYRVHAIREYLNNYIEGKEAGYWL